MGRSFRHLNAVSGLEILITSGPAIDGYYLRQATQVDELLRWLSDQHAAGVTVRGGKIRPTGEATNSMWKRNAWSASPPKNAHVLRESARVPRSARRTSGEDAGERLLMRISREVGQVEE